MAEDNTIIRPPAPKFGINEIVYFRESAMLGFLETAKVTLVHYDPSVARNVYTFVYRRTKQNNQIAGDAIDLRSGDKQIHMVEDNLVTYKEALQIKANYLERELIKTQQQIANAPD